MDRMIIFAGIIAVVALLALFIVVYSISKNKKQSAKTSKPVAVAKQPVVEKQPEVVEEVVVAEKPKTTKKPAAKKAEAKVVEEEVKSETKTEEVKEEVEKQPTAKTKKPATKKAEVKPEAKTETKTEVKAVKYHVAQNKDEDSEHYKKWRVRKQGSQKTIKYFETQKEAIEYAESLADAAGSSVVIHKVDGSIRKQNYTKKD